MSGEPNPWAALGTAAAGALESITHAYTEAIRTAGEWVEQVGLRLLLQAALEGSVQNPVRVRWDQERDKIIVLAATDVHERVIIVHPLTAVQALHGSGWASLAPTNAALLERAHQRFDKATHRLYNAGYGDRVEISNADSKAAYLRAVADPRSKPIVLEDGMVRSAAKQHADLVASHGQIFADNWRELVGFAAPSPAPLRSYDGSVIPRPDGYPGVS